MEYPLVSVLMSVYHEPIEWIRIAIESILSQTFSDFEFIIVVDAPDRRDLNQFLNTVSSEDLRIRIIVNGENIGLTKSLNVGLEKCRGKYVARMDADDFSLPERLEKQVDFMNNNPDVIASSAMAFKWNGSEIGPKLFRPVTNQEFQEYLFTSSPFIHPLLIMRRDVLLDNGIKYDENFKVGQDYKLAADLNEIGKLVNLDEVLMHYRVSNSQISSVRGREQVENGCQIRRILVNSFYSKIGMNPIEQEFTVDTLKDNYKKNKTLDNNQKRIMNCIRRDFYYSLQNYSIKTLLLFLISGDYLHAPYNFRRFGVIVAKHFKKNIVPSLL